MSCSYQIVCILYTNPLFVVAVKGTTAKAQLPRCRIPFISGSPEIVHPEIRNPRYPVIRILYPSLHSTPDCTETEEISYFISVLYDMMWLLWLLKTIYGFRVFSIFLKFPCTQAVLYTCKVRAILWISTHDPYLPCCTISCVRAVLCVRTVRVPIIPYPPSTQIWTYLPPSWIFISQNHKIRK